MKITCNSEEAARIASNAVRQVRYDMVDLERIAKNRDGMTKAQIASLEQAMTNAKTTLDRLLPLAAKLTLVNGTVVLEDDELSVMAYANGFKLEKETNGTESKEVLRSTGASLIAGASDR